MNLNKIGHKDIFTDYSKLRNTIDEGGVNLGKKQKYGFLSTAYRLKQELSLSANPVECRAKKDVLNEYRKASVAKVKKAPVTAKQATDSTVKPETEQKPAGPKKIRIEDIGGW